MGSPAGQARGPVAIAQPNGAGPRHAIPVPAEVALHLTNGAKPTVGSNGAGTPLADAIPTAKERSAPGSRRK